MSPAAVAAVAPSTEPAGRGGAVAGPVLHMVASGGLYGIERMLLGLLPSLRELGCDAVLGSLGPPGGPSGALGAALESLGYSATEARRAAGAVAGADGELDARIKAALQELARSR